VKCWGQNAYGQLGVGSGASRVIAYDVSGLTSGVIAISAGAIHTCALTSAGAVKCWGDNSYGQLGDNTSTSRLTPVDVFGLGSGIIAISAGSQHTCAIRGSGQAQCWGDNTYGQLGNNSTTGSLVPVDVVGLDADVSGIAASNGHTCVRTEAAAMQCWGANFSGELGNNSTTGSLTPVGVSGLGSGVSAISAGRGSHTCAIANGAAAKCWGDNTYGQLGNNNTTNSSIPVDVTGLSISTVGITVGNVRTCGLSGSGGVYCWGNNWNGGLGNNSTAHSSVPVSVIGLESGVAALAAGGSHSCALTESGGVRCWGSNWYGQIGHGSSEDSFSVPVDVLMVSVPDAPGMGGAVPGNESLSVYFIAPARDGGASVDSYRVSCDSGSVAATGNASPIALTGLTNGASYACTVAAHNSEGWSAESAFSNPVTPSSATISKAHRAFVSAKTGSDSNIVTNCQVIAPCRTFATAVGIVSARGEIVAMDSGDYSAVTITDSVSLVGAPGAQAGVSGGTQPAVSIGTPGVAVVLRGLSFSGPGDSIVMTAGASLSVETCSFRGVRDAIRVTGSTRVQVLDSSVQDAYRGIHFADGVRATIAGSKLGGIKDRGIVASGESPDTHTVVNVAKTVVSGVRAASDEWAIMGLSTAPTARVDLSITHSVMTSSYRGVFADSYAGAPVSVTIAKSQVTGNFVGLTGGVITSLGNNVITDNGTNVVGTVNSLPPR
jgi:alpha-tubulin suppressor-like RCC1 family protein